MAQIIGIREAQTTSATTVYDPTCGSGSLLLKVGDEARAKVTLYGQEKDAATSVLARMNMILHKQLISKKRHLKQGAMQELLTGKKRLPGFSGKCFRETTLVGTPPSARTVCRRGG